MQIARSSHRKKPSYRPQSIHPGGGEIYRATLSKADRMILSYIDAEYAGDEYFPEFDEDEWIISKKEVYDQFTVVYYERGK